MDFTHDTTVTLGTAAALVNTAPGLGPSGEEDLPSIAALDGFLTAHGWTHRTHRTRDLTEVQALRPRLQELWTAPLPRLVDGVNLLLEEGAALPRLVHHGDDYGWHIHATREGAPLAHAIQVEIAMALVDLVRAGQHDRLSTCAAADCDDVVVDLSRNRSRRYCEGTCANRAHVAAYRARKARQTG